MKQLEAKLEQVQEVAARRLRAMETRLRVRREAAAVEVPTHLPGVAALAMDAEPQAGGHAEHRPWLPCFCAGGWQGTATAAECTQ